MKTACLLLFIVCIGSVAYAQNPDSVSQDPIYFEVEQQAEFTGGLEAMTKFLNDNIVYPPKARKKNIQGKVFVKFIVEKDGSLSNIEVIKGVSRILDQEALRIVSISPAWIPGKQSGKIVRSQFVLPINFVLY
jgi:protein TonB